jgi:hypothetical protein
MWMNFGGAIRNDEIDEQPSAGRPTKARHARRVRGIQYAAAYRFHHCCLWITRLRG